MRDATDERVLYVGDDAPAAFGRAKALLWTYRFYPSSIVSGELAEPAKGVVIEQRIRVGPMRFRGPVRIDEVWDRATPDGRTCGYQYTALPGHVERGWARFELALAGTRVSFRIASRSAPGHPLARAFPFVARHFQRRAVEGALEIMRAEASRGAS